MARPDLDVCGEVAYGHCTPEKNPVTARAALTTLRMIKDEGLVDNAERIGAMTKSRLPHMMERLSLINDIRGRGYPWAIELVRDRATQEPSSDTAEDVLYFALRRGLSFKISMGNVLTLAPPLVTTPEQMSDAFDLADQGVSEVQ